MLFQLLLHFIFLSWGSEAHSSMNGYRFKEFNGFEKNWHFVTVRYRKDTGELRLTYANDKAWKALLTNPKTYPNGSRFGKISIRTENDFSFPSSQVPSGKVRYTFMVRDSKKHKSTGGWGYALFSPDGKPHPGNHQEKSMACAACHQLVKNQGQVFSKPMGFELNMGPGAHWSHKIRFKKVSRNQLPQKIKDKIPKKFTEVYQIQGVLTENLFYGTLDEIRPALLKNSLKTGSPSALIGKKGQQFSLVVPTKNKKCLDGKGFTSFHTPEKTQAGKDSIKLNLCGENV